MKKVHFIFLAAQVIAGVINAQTLDNAFDASKVRSGFVRAIAYQSDGKIFIGGKFAPFGMDAVMIARLNSNGSLDNTFGTAAGYHAGEREVRAIALQPDGKVIIGGQFDSYNGITCKNIARLNPDGSLDDTFHGWLYGEIYAITLQPDGKILAGGWHTNSMTRLNSDGSFDNTFQGWTDFNVDVYAITLQADSNILIGGLFTSYSGMNHNHIARLHSDGSLDTTFNPGTGADDIVNAIALQNAEDGKILIGGHFATYNGTSQNQIARLNRDGSLDTTFKSGSGNGAGNYVSTIALQPTGGILIGGHFTTYNDTGRNRIARLNRDGSLDTSFDPGIGANGDVSTIILQPDGKILIGGSFNKYNATTRSGIVRLINNIPLEVFDEKIGGQSLATIYPVPTHENIFITTGEQTAERIDVMTMLGQVVASIKPSSPRTEISLTHRPKGMYFVTVTSKNIRQTFKLVKGE